MPATDGKREKEPMAMNEGRTGRTDLPWSGLPGIRYGFTGSRDLDENGEKIVTSVLALLAGGEVYTTGACVGVDAFIGLSLWLAEPNATHRVVVPADRSRVNYWWCHRAIADSVLVEEMPTGTTYKDRNQRIVDRSDVVVAFPAHAEDDPRSRRSGTWQTVRMARRKKLSVVLAVLDQHGRAVAETEGTRDAPVALEVV